MEELKTGILKHSSLLCSDVSYLEGMERNQDVHGFHPISCGVGDPHEDATHFAHSPGKADQVSVERVVEVGR